MPEWFRRRSSAASTPQQSSLSSAVTADAGDSVPEGTFTKCVKCGALLITKDFERDLKVCSKCGHHHRLSADERIAYTVDEGSFVEWGNDFVASDPLKFPDYRTKIDNAAKSESGRNDGLVTGNARISEMPCVLCISDFAFARLGGTMGSVFGEKFVRAADRALADRCPLIFFCASGGARMQEGLFGLMQMAKTSAAVAHLAQHGIPYLVILTDPTTGGALASIASLGDVIYAEPGATVAFAGDRVSAQAQTHKPPANYKTAEFQLDHGQLDRIVARKEMPTTLARTIGFFGVGFVGSEEPAITGDASIAHREVDEISGAKRNGSAVSLSLGRA